MRRSKLIWKWETEMVKKWTLWMRIKFAWQAFKNARRSVYGIPVGVEYNLDGILPSQANAYFAQVQMLCVDEDGREYRASLRV